MFCRRKRCMMNRFLRCGGFYGRSWESDSIRIFDRTVSRGTKNFEPQATAVELAQLGEGCRGQANVINLKRLLNGKQNVWKYQNGEEKSDSDGREKDV